MSSALNSRQNVLQTNESTNPASSKKYVTSDDLYRNSTQYQMWSFNRKQLAQMRQKANKKGRKEALERFDRARIQFMAENPMFTPENCDFLTPEILNLITVEEEQSFLRFISTQIVQICAHFNMPTQVRATLMSFFRKFYLINSVMEYRPKNIAYTIVFLAAKLENYFVSIESFCLRIPKTKPADILDLEYVFLETLQFTLLVHHPFRPLWGFFLDFQQMLLHPAPVMYDVSVNTLSKLYDDARKWLNERAIFSDAGFLFTPPQIALAAMYSVNKKVVECYLQLKFPDSSRLIKTIKECIQEVEAGVETSREGSAKIDERCFFILAPGKLLKKRAKQAKSEAKENE